jgi:hypothetical protein
LRRSDSRGELGIVPGTILLPMLAAILVISAVQIWRHK